MPTATPRPRRAATPIVRAPVVRIYTYPDCPDTRRLVAFLQAQRVSFELSPLDGLPTSGASTSDDCGFVSPTVEVGRDVLVRPDCGDLERLLRSHGLVTGRLTPPKAPAAAACCPVAQAA